LPRDPADARITLPLPHCLVSLIDDVEIPAEKPGRLVRLAAREGTYVETGAGLAAIDDVQAGHQAEAARADLIAARAKAESDLEVVYAIATHRTAQAELNIAETANANHANTVALVEVEKLRLAAEQARIKIGVSRFEHNVRGLESESFAAKSRLADADLAKHRISAPLPGEVVEVFAQEGEWLEAGKPILRMVRLDRLRVEGFIRFDALAPADVIGRPVIAKIVAAEGRTAAFEGRVTFVSPLVEPGGEYRIWAEVENRRERGQWLLRPGLEAELAIQMVGDRN
jgi:macrolide-specific efflux system membrane fusion protein